MTKLLYTVLSIIILSACSIINPDRSDFVADKHSYVNKINLLEYDKKLGITRDLKKTTEETVNTNSNIHKKTITINETLEMQGAKGDAQAVLVFDSASQQRSGERSIHLSDDGSVSLDKFVKKFETSQYKSISNDKFSNIAPVVQETPLDIINIDDNKSFKKTIIRKKTSPIKAINNNLDVMGSSKSPHHTKSSDTQPANVTMKPIAQYDDNNKKNIINSVVLNPINNKLLTKATSNPTPIHTWL
jgi:hypothetical protein